MTPREIAAVLYDLRAECYALRTENEALRAKRDFHWSQCITLKIENDALSTANRVLLTKRYTPRP